LGGNSHRSAGKHAWRWLLPFFACLFPCSGWNVQAAACGACHANIAEHFRHNAMSRSFGPLAKAARLEAYDEVEVSPRESSQFYRVVKREGRVYQEAFEKDAAGREVRRFELEATHALGSGQHARTYLHLDEAGELIELPLTWYQQERRWAMSPGYDRPDNARFTRVVDAGCLFCHMARPAVKVRYGVRQPWTSALPETGIDCGRCHGPGERHIELASQGAANAQIRQAIVNPARLPQTESLDVCLQCHLQSTSAELPHAVRRFGRDVFSFLPGEKLSDYLVQFDHPAEAGRSGKFEVNGAGYRLLQSPCFRKSGQLTCITCHSPHAQARDVAKVCVGCHQPHTDDRGGDCVACHMPKRRTEDAVHVVLSDHRIPRGPIPGNPTAPLPEKDDVYRGDIRFLREDSITGTERSLYLGMALVEHGADLPRGLAMLRDALARTARPPVEAQAALARALSMSGKASEGAAVCRAALQVNPRLSALRAECAKLLEESGQKTRALEQYRAAYAADPGIPAAAFGIARLTQDTAEAGRMYRVAAGSLPLRADALNNLARIAALGGDLPGAFAQVEQALQLAPDLSEVRYNRAQLLNAAGRAAEAIAEYQELVRRKPGFVQAHLALGNALADEGRLREAVEEFRIVLRLEPSNREGQEHLRMALEMLGK